MPSTPKELSVLFSGILGVNVSVDPSTLPAEVFQRSQNFVPTTAFTLARRPGVQLLDDAIAASIIGIPAAIRFTYQGHRYTYIVINTLLGSLPDTVYVSIDNGAFVAVTNGAFDASGLSTYDFAVYGGFVYCSNGQNPTKQIAVGGNAEDLVPLETWVDVTPDPTIESDPGSTLLTGTYSYCWGVYNGEKWLRRSEPRTITINTTGDRSLIFTTPSASYLLEANTSFHLFLAPVILPIEYAHDQTPEGFTADQTITVRAVTVEQTPVPMVGFLTRKGRYLVAHRGRIWLAHDSTFPEGVRRVYATNVILPGWEQTIFDQGRFFPANAVIHLPDTITGIGVMSLTGTQRSPESPLAIFTNTQTWLFIGDILDDPDASLVQRSDRIGCISHKSITSTPYGLVFVGVESVYLLSPDGNIRDIGWPIRTVIQSITPARRQRVLGVYHDGFYKLFLSIDGNLTNREMWWLDLRRGIPQLPSWWGPHRIAADAAIPDSIALGTDETVVDERLFGFSANGTWSEFNIGSKDHDETFEAIAISGLVDAGKPFDRKLATRVRIVAKPGDTTNVNATVIADEQFTQNLGFMELLVTGGIWWEGNIDMIPFVSDWCPPLPPVDDVYHCATWSTAYFTEGTALAEADRLRGQAFAVRILHGEPRSLEIRHIELALLPIVRNMRENYA